MFLRGRTGFFEIFKIGLDNSVGLTNICCDRGFEVIVSDCLNCPFRSSCADFIISIAVIHHLSIEYRRLNAIAEIVRLLKPGGKALVYVWAMEQKHQNVKSHYVTKKKSSATEMETEKQSEKMETTELENELGSAEKRSQNEQFIPRHVNRTPFAQQDLFVPWQRKIKQSKPTDAVEKGFVSNCGKSDSTENGDTFYRFYHVFKKGELEELCLKASDQVDIVDSYFDDGNWCIIVQKK